jgi:dienelactone hydrolase
MTGDAGVLASHGYATFALQYFGADGLSPTLSTIPLGYFDTAMEWLTDHETVAPEGIGLLGLSKGGELALLLGARDSPTEIQTVIGYVPSAYVFEAVDGGTSSWAVEGEPVPYIPYPPVLPTQFSEDGKQILRPLYRTAVKKADAETTTNATIHVENIDGSVLLISGHDDALWPSTSFSRKVVERLNAYGHSYPYDHLSYKNAGHGIRYPYILTTGSTETDRYELGGTPAGNAHAAADSWPRVLDYLTQALAPPARSSNK